MHPELDALTQTKRSRWILAAFGLIPATLGTIVLIGWYAHSLVLIQLRPTLAPMQYNTALCLLLSGIALAALAWGRAQFSKASAAVVIAFSGLTLCEHLFRSDLGIDRLLFKSLITVQTANSGRMSPVTTLCFLQIGFALLLMSWRTGSRWRIVLAGSLGSIVFAVGTLAVVGYMLGLAGAYSWGLTSRIALVTASGVGILGAGICAFWWEIGRDTDERTHRWLPLPVGLSAFTASLVLWHALATKQRQEALQNLRTSAETVRNLLSVRMDARIRSLERTARRWEFSGRPTQAAWEEDMNNFAKDNPEIEAVEWIDASHKIQWIAPLKGNEAKLRLDLTQEERRHAAVQKAEEQHQPVITQAVKLFRGDTGFLLYAPIYVGTEFDGLVAEVIKAQQLFGRYLPPAVAPGSAVSISEGGQIIYERSRGLRAAKAPWIVNSNVELHGAVWDISVWPTPELRTQLDTPLPEIAMGAGTIASLLLAMTTYLAQKASTRAKEADQANSELQVALAEVKTLTGLLPICTHCKRVRDDTGYWSRIESYLSRHSDASFSHGYCPECAVKAFEDAGLEVPDHIRAAQAEHKYD